MLEIGYYVKWQRSGVEIAGKLLNTLRDLMKIFSLERQSDVVPYKEHQKRTDVVRFSIPI